MRRPSAALVVATAALVMSTIGTSFAARQYVISSPGQIKPGAISLKALSKAARKSLHGARGPAGPAGTAGVPGAPGATGVPGTPATKLWAQIGADGTVNASSGGVTARAGVSPGSFAVNFAQDITHCATLATQASIPNFAGAGLSMTGVQGAAFVSMSSTGVDFAAGFPSQTSARVQTNRANGTAVATSFTVAVFC